MRFRKRDDVDELIEESTKLREDLLAASEKLARFTTRLTEQIAEMTEGELHEHDGG